MESKEAVKMEDPVKSSYTVENFLGSNSNMLTSLFDYSGEGEKGSLGFMELLGMQDFGASMFDMSQQVAASVQTENTRTSTVVQEPSEVVNTPATPNCSSISSESSGAPSEMQSKALDDEEEQQKITKKQLKPKKTSQKRQREPRFAFMTKSDVDHLEDGYRWRKYGQKAVKNSPFPRSYYRCTSASCNVKKRVERSCSDPSIVVTTYEGQHTHPSPMMPRPTPISLPSASSFPGNRVNSFALPMHMAWSHQPQFINNLTPLNCNYTSSIADPVEELQMRRFCSTPHSAALLRDNGLLQDIVPSIIRKEE